MLTPQEQEFIRYWDANRLRRKKVLRQFLVGIPIGLLFVVPIAVNFASGWYKRAEMEANTEDFNPMVLFLALLVIVVFTAIFYQRHRWDMYEQRYQELLARQKRDTASSADPATTPSAAPAPAIPGASASDAGSSSQETPATTSSPLPGTPPAGNADIPAAGNVDIPPAANSSEN